MESPLIQHYLGQFWLNWFFFVTWVQLQKAVTGLAQQVDYVLTHWDKPGVDERGAVAGAVITRIVVGVWMGAGEWNDDAGGIQPPAYVLRGKVIDSVSCAERLIRWLQR